MTTKTKPRHNQTPSPDPVVSALQGPDEVRAILWGIASDRKQSGTARVSACRLLLMQASDDGHEAHQDADLNKRALALMRRVAN